MSIWVFIAVVSDLFRDHELSGAAKAAWILGLVVFPMVGSLAYVVVRGRGMAERSAAQHRMAREGFDSYVREAVASSGTGPVDDLARLAALRDNGTIDDTEFDALKARVMAPTA